MAELLVWHDALGSDDEQATDEERAARLLYAYTSAKVETPLAGDGDQQQQQQHKLARGMHSLQFMEALVAFTRLLRRPSSDASQWTNVTLASRRFCVQEVEPHIYIALGVKRADLCGDGVRSVHAAVLQQIYDMFRLFHGRFDRSLRQVHPDLGSRFEDGMALLRHIGALRRRLRKIAIALELEEHGTQDGVIVPQVQLRDENARLKKELEELVAKSPSRRLWRHCEVLFPKLISEMEVTRMNAFHEMDGVAYFPMDEATFLAMHTLINSFLMQMESVVGGGIALFYKGNVLWRTIDASTTWILQRYLRLREQDGMDVATKNNPLNQVSGSRWMSQKYDDAFSPIWASKTTYAECAVVRHFVPQPRRSGRAIHKQAPSSMTSLLNELLDTNGDSSSSEQRQIRKSQRYRSDAPVYRNRGFLTTSGYFLPSWELAKAESSDTVWAPTVFQLQNDSESTAMLYHENDLSMVILTKRSATSAALLQHMERIEDCLEKLQFAAMATSIGKNYVATTGSHLSRDKAASVSQPPYIYLNRVNLAFKVADQLPRLIKAKEMDLYPRPASIWGHYFPAAALELLNEAHDTLQRDRETVELWVKTVNDGWLVAHRSLASGRELYVLLDTKAASVADAQDATTDLIAQQFSNIHL